MASSQTITTATEILLEKYLEPARKSFYSKSILLDRLRKKSTKLVGGRYFVYPLWSTRNEAAGPRAEGGTLPTPDSIGYDRAIFYPCTNYVRFNISGWLMDADDMSSIVDTLQMEMRGAKDRLNEVCNIQMFRWGTDVVGRLKTENTTTPVLYEYNTDYATTTFFEGSKYIRPGHKLTFFAPHEGTRSGWTETCSAVNSDGKTITTASNVADETNPEDLICVVGYDSALATVDTADTSTFTNGPFGRAMFGLSAGCGRANPRFFHATGGTSLPFAGTEGTSGSITTGGDTTGLYGGINRTTAGNEFWLGNMRNWGSASNAYNGGRTAGTIGMMYQAVHDCEFNGGNVSLIVTSPQLWRQYGVGAVRQWQNNVTTIDGGWKALDFAGIPVVADKHCPAGHMFFLDESTWDVLQEGEPQFMDKDGSVLIRSGTGSSATDSYEATLYWRSQLACAAPNRNAMYYGIDESTAFLYATQP